MRPSPSSAVVVARAAAEREPGKQESWRFLALALYRQTDVEPASARDLLHREAGRAESREIDLARAAANREPGTPRWWSALADAARRRAEHLPPAERAELLRMAEEASATERRLLDRAAPRPAPIPSTR